MKQNNKIIVGGEKPVIIATEMPPSNIGKRLGLEFQKYHGVIDHENVEDVVQEFSVSPNIGSNLSPYTVNVIDARKYDYSKVVGKDRNNRTAKVKALKKRVKKRRKKNKSKRRK